jgi:hypothetical protein
MKERRLLFRHPCHLPATCSPAPEGDILGSATVSDISAGGVAVLVNHPIEPDTVLYLDLGDKDRGASHRLLVQVVHARQKEGGWLLGCALSTFLTARELSGLLRAEKGLAESA